MTEEDDSEARLVWTVALASPVFRLHLRSLRDRCRLKTICKPLKDLVHDAISVLPCQVALTTVQALILADPTISSYFIIKEQLEHTPIAALKGPCCQVIDLVQDKVTVCLWMCPCGRPLQPTPIAALASDTALFSVVTPDEVNPLPLHRDIASDLLTLSHYSEDCKVRQRLVLADTAALTAAVGQLTSPSALSGLMPSMTDAHATLPDGPLLRNLASKVTSVILSATTVIDCMNRPKPPLPNWAQSLLQAGPCLYSAMICGQHTEQQMNTATMPKLQPCEMAKNSNTPFSWTSTMLEAYIHQESMLRSLHAPCLTNASHNQAVQAIDSSSECSSSATMSSSGSGSTSTSNAGCIASTSTSTSTSATANIPDATGDTESSSSSSIPPGECCTVGGHAYRVPASKPQGGPPSRQLFLALRGLALQTISNRSFDNVLDLIDGICELGALVRRQQTWQAVPTNQHAAGINGAPHQPPTLSNLHYAIAPEAVANAIRQHIVEQAVACPKAWLEQAAAQLLNRQVLPDVRGYVQIGWREGEIEGRCFNLLSGGLVRSIRDDVYEEHGPYDTMLLVSEVGIIDLMSSAHKAVSCLCAAPGGALAALTYAAAFLAHAWGPWVATGQVAGVEALLAELATWVTKGCAADLAADPAMSAWWAMALHLLPSTYTSEEPTSIQEEGPNATSEPDGGCCSKSCGSMTVAEACFKEAVDLAGHILWMHCLNCQGHESSSGGV